MYRAFTLTDVDAGSFNQSDPEDLLARGEGLTTKNRTIVKKALDAFVTTDGSLDGSRLQQHWFPQVEADVFISHSHTDERLAELVAGWLNRECRLTTFIDSCVWGYADDLLWQIDNRHSKSGDNLFSYETRNLTTSHIHMMLTRALSMMIDRTECLLFLRTPTSINSQEAVAKTESPWLYMELGVAAIIDRKKPNRNADTVNENFARVAKTASFHMKYDVSGPLESLTPIDHDTLNEWRATQKAAKGHALDTLYGIAAERSSCCA